jgi:hypothetical protein
VTSQTVADVWSVLWELFGEFGLPECILSDNGPAFHSGAKLLPSRMDVFLLRLGIRFAHGRPRHPQTQGKVERFHRTIADELGRELRQPTAREAGVMYERFRDYYNWERPHDALALKRPGEVYVPSAKKRPNQLPSHDIPDGAVSRKVDDYGNFGFRSRRYKIGRAFAGERIVLQEGQNGWTVAYFNRELGPLEGFEV